MGSKPVLVVLYCIIATVARVGGVGIELDEQEEVLKHRHGHHHAAPVTPPTPSDDDGLTLEFVQIVWRHGDRSPLLFYPTDPYSNYWPQVPGMLTQEGMRQHYQLGQYLRSRYMPHFLDSHYLRNETYVMSSNVDRAIESAASNLAAFYAPQDWQVFDRSLNWQPVPIHTIPPDEDHFLDPPYEECPKYMKIADEFQQSSEYKEYSESVAPLLARLSQYVGAPVTMDNVSFLYDNLLCVKAHHLTPSKWESEDLMKELALSANYVFFNVFRTKEQQRLLGGTLLKSLRNVFLNKIENKSESMLAKKMVIYSAHDTTLIALTRLLDIFNFLRPPYASALILELYSDRNKDYFLKILYRNVTETEVRAPYELALPLCNGKVLCPFFEFFANSSDLVLDDWNAECALSLMDTFNAQHENGHVIRFLVLAIFFILGTFGIFLSIELYCCYVKRIIEPSKLKLDISFTGNDALHPSA